jgi:hypothetical protein
MLTILNQLFTEDEMLSKGFVAKKYTLTTSDGDVILPQFWEMTVEPGMKLRVKTPAIVRSWNFPRLDMKDKESAVLGRDDEVDVDVGDGSSIRAGSRDGSDHEPPFESSGPRRLSDSASGASTPLSAVIGPQKIMGPIGGLNQVRATEKRLHRDFSSVEQKLNLRVQSPAEARATAATQATTVQRAKYQFEADSSNEDEEVLDRNSNYLSGAADRLKHLAKAQGIEVEAQNKNLAALWNKVSYCQKDVGSHLLIQTSQRRSTSLLGRKNPGKCFQRDLID